MLSWSRLLQRKPVRLKLHLAASVRSNRLAADMSTAWQQVTLSCRRIRGNAGSRLPPRCLPPQLPTPQSAGRRPSLHGRPVPKPEQGQPAAFCPSGSATSRPSEHAESALSPPLDGRFYELLKGGGRLAAVGGASGDTGFRCRSLENAAPSSMIERAAIARKSGVPRRSRTEPAPAPSLRGGQAPRGPSPRCRRCRAKG